MSFPAKLSDAPAAENAYLSSLNGTKEAISVSIKNLAEGLSGKLAAGDIVSVIAPDYKKQGSTVIPPELTYVEVIGVTASSGNDTDQTKTESGKSDSEDEEKQLPATVTLLATSDQAKILAELESEGSIHLSLVYRGDKNKADEFLATQDKLLSALYPKTTSSSSGTASDSNSVPSGTNAPAASSAAPESEGK
jgi:pilus assembly protein CpaB